MSQKILGLKDIIIMSVVANVGIRWLPIAGAMGPISLVFWCLGALLFLIPLSLIVAELSSKYSDEGGVYAWVRHQLGDGPAFIVSWFYWVNNLFFYPAILTFFASSLAYAFGNAALANNETFITLTVIIAFWSVTFITIQGLRVGKSVAEVGGILGSFFIIMLLIVLSGIFYVKFHHSATSFSFSAFHFGGGLFHNLSSLSILMFAMAGIEIIPTIANSVKDPHKTLPRGLIIAAFLVLGLYIFGTAAMNIVASPNEIAQTTGLMSSFAVIGDKLHLHWLEQVVALLVVFAELGAITIWVFLPVIMFFKATQRGILPERFHRVNKHEMPANALFFQAWVVTGIIILTTSLPSVQLMYQILVLMTTTTYFIPYFFLLAAYLKFKLKHKDSGRYVVPGGRVGAVLMSFVVLCSLVLAIVLSFVPTANLKTVHDIFIYEAELLGGPIILFLIALGLYHRAKRHGTLR